MQKLGFVGFCAKPSCASCYSRT